ncbi:MAG: hypothetical protein V7704_20620 [Aurantimonas endophytica]|uniref:hypothetical protein n=1 Tax=Aurantimonas endophytica TaxID=1522175 RepID=UPI0030010AAB
MTLLFPVGALRPQSIDFNLTPQNTRGATSLTGGSQVIASSAGLWTATVRGIRVYGRDNLLLWRTLEARLEGTLNPILIPVCQGNRQPYPAVQPIAYGGIPHGDGTSFSDGSGYYQRAIDASLLFSVPRGAVQAWINVTVGGDLEPGQYFSLGERLYRIKSIEKVSGAASFVKFWPTAREAAPAGTRVEFDKPHCKMRLRSDDGMALATEMNKRANPTIELQEDLS